MTTINTFLVAIREALSTAFPGLKSCETHPGQFTIQELTKISTQCPAMRVAVYEAPKVTPDPSGEQDITLGLSIVILTTDTTVDGKMAQRHEIITNILSALLTMLPGYTWNCDYAHGATDVRAVSHYAHMTGKRVAMWEVTFRQTIRLGTPEWTDEGIIPLQIYASHAPEIGADHEDDYEEIQPSEVPFELP